MKKELIKLAVLLPALSILFTSCEKYRCFEGDGNVQTETRFLKNFDEVEADISANIELIYDTSLTVPKIVIKAREDVLKKIETEVEVGALLIDSRRCISSSSPVEIQLYVNELERFDLDGSGNVFSYSNIQADEFEVNIHGSGNIDLSVDAQEVSTKVSGSGDIDLSGSAHSLIGKVSGSGNINTASLPVSNANVTITGSGNIRTNASSILNVKITGSGNVYYSGNPNLNVGVTGSGDVIKF